ncbi:hypothetical protein BpOF4_12755 [Alkalihalophilus pseudofirmus OF4]|uniref:Uncharacterized protein n=1 Tax=Alkalihalophilus pseudofirmus (strain ATCC BAA-2126 / JCM 17055 / OF4) TaxID=398511 RepID=D3FWV4_ALKPO|nr:hypothetical protein [Alkalihalophilus pseudofirmus]ADC50602.1 hypothetical protein BpOF4_12755 [Alkalihalophilus pseudofirmus OF4]
MTIIDILYILLIFFIGVQLTMSLVTAIIGNTGMRMMEFSYIKGAKKIGDKILNLSFYALYGLPHFFYNFFMKRFSYVVARILYVFYVIGLIISIIIFLLISSFITEVLM